MVIISIVFSCIFHNKNYYTILKINYLIFLLSSRWAIQGHCKVLEIQGFGFVNPEIHKFKKTVYLD